MFKEVIKSIRPATLVVTLLSTTLGVVVAYKQGYIIKNLPWDTWRIFLVTVAGLLLQSGMNLMNNYFEEDVEGKVGKVEELTFLGYKRSKEEIVNFKVGIVFFIITTLIGVYLSYYSGRQLFFIEIIGIFAAYAYDGKPFNYKKYGLGVIMSFVMMGPLMVYGSFFVFSGRFSALPIFYSFTLGLFIPAILLANELRDYEEDKRRGVNTLTVRIGYKNSKRLYSTLILFAYINTIILIIFKLLPVASGVVLTTIPLLKQIKGYIECERKLLVPATAKVYLIFGLQFLLILALN